MSNSSLEWLKLLHRGAAVAIAILASSTAASAQTDFQVLHDFTTAEGVPSSPLVQGADGNLYGTTSKGGAFNKGTVFVMTPDAVTVLHSFDGTDGAAPGGGFIQARDGNFYGGTRSGGQFSRGTIFRMTPDGTVTVLASVNAPHCGGPSSLVETADGTLYGTGTLCNGPAGGGRIFRMTPDGTVTTLRTFPGQLDGPAVSPTEIIQVVDGSFWITARNANDPSGGGFIFHMAQDGSSITHEPGPPRDSPTAITQGADEQLYVTAIGGSPYPDHGQIFRMNADGSFTLLYQFTEGAQFSVTVPNRLLLASNGDFYGTTRNYFTGTGMIYRMTPDGEVTILMQLGTLIASPLIQTSDGSFYGNTSFGGAFGNGMVFRLNSGGSCQYVLSPDSADFPGDGGDGDASMTTAAGCSWMASANASWITLNPSSGTGDGTLTYTVAPNDRPRIRSATIQAALRTLVVTQAPAPCHYSLSPAGTVGPSGGTGNVTMTATYDECEWTASTSASWILLTTQSGAGTATLSFGLQPNTSNKSRTAAITVADQMTVVTQRGRQGADFDGVDGRSDLTVFRPSTGLWCVLNSSTNYSTSASHSWGLSADTPVPDDYDGDGKTDPAVFRPSTGGWYILESSTNYTTSRSVSWGLSTDIPVPGDYDGDGKADPAVFRPSTGGWYILESSTGYTTSLSLSWGLSTDAPVAGDYDGDGRTDPAVYRPSTGGWYILKSSTNYTASQSASWGLSTDIPVPGDYDGDGKTDPAVYRPSTGGWYILQSTTGYSTSAGVSWGLSTDTPVPGDYDGDGQIDPAVFRSSTGTWLILTSSSRYSHYTSTPSGIGSVIPINKRP